VKGGKLRKRNGVIDQLDKLRSTFNFARSEMGMREGADPFAGFSWPTKEEGTLHPPSREEINRYEQWVKDNPDERQSDSIRAFLFQFYIQGMRISDTILFKKTDRVGDRAVFRQQKSKGAMSSKMRGAALWIYDYYKDSEGEYLFPFMNGRKNTKNQRESRVAMINRWINQVGPKIGIERNITSHMARHAVGRIMDEKGFSNAEMAANLGHRSEKAANTYRGRLVTDRKDELGDRIYD